ncbi:hypothetical protein [Coleofasciculus sp. FACHB-1120]|uniref:hypothetical protein n=1 Tax=Coleofasciculus sp. FACHB-1120 TaxID=2692783 RepID=UPI00168A187D|nr:hypothetical protein [Coleofasciculus sp. FACHB-1120]MBD2740231.1 hypothetical protein [Coleofasciculus sp. FACHB-1120]
MLNRKAEARSLSFTSVGAMNALYGAFNQQAKETATSITPPKICTQNLSNTSLRFQAVV